MRPGSRRCVPSPSAMAVPFGRRCPFSCLGQENAVSASNSPISPIVLSGHAHQGEVVSRFEQTSVADIGRWASRYLPYLALVVVVALVVVFTPGRDRRTDDVSATGGSAGAIAGSGRTGGAASGSASASDDAQSTGGADAGTGNVQASGTSAGSGG